MNVLAKEIWIAETSVLLIEMKAWNNCRKLPLKTTEEELKKIYF